MAFVSWLEIILAVSIVAVAFGDGFRLVDASVAFLVATITILGVLVD